MKSEYMSNGLSCHRYTQVAMEEFHQHNEIEFSILDSGSHNAYFGGELRRTPTRCIGCGWAMIPHRALDGNVTSYVVNLPLPWFLSRNFPQAFVSTILHGQWLFDPQEDNGDADVQRFMRWHGLINGADERLREVALLEIEARLLELAVTLESADKLTTAAVAGQSHHAANATELGKVERMAAYIATNYRSNLSLSQVAREVNLHPNYAHTLFRQNCGTTVAQNLTQHRLWHAQRLLATTDLPMVKVASAAGFGSDSQFYAVFKRHCNLSPHAYRQAVQGG